MRGFPEFIEAVRTILKQKQNVEVIIAGDDRIVYGSKIPPEGSFGRWAKQKLKRFIEDGRVAFTGHLSTKHYARLLKSSHLHCYFTRPFVASWSILEAMSSGCYILATDLPVTREFLSHEGTCWTNHTHKSCIEEKLADCLNMSDHERIDKGSMQREEVVQNWESSISLEKWRGLLGI